MANDSWKHVSFNLVFEDPVSPCIPGCCGTPRLALNSRDLPVSVASGVLGLKACTTATQFGNFKNYLFFNIILC